MGALQGRALLRARLSLRGHQVHRSGVGVVDRVRGRGGIDTEGLYRRSDVSGVSDHLGAVYL